VKSLLFLLLGSVVGFFAVVGLADWMPSRERGDGRREPVPLEGIPEEARSQISIRLTKARSAPQDRENQRLLQRDVDRWLLADPRGCIDWLHREGALGLVRREHLRDVFASAFHGDLSMAIREALQIPNGRLRAEWLEVVFEEAQESSPERAFELLRHLPTHLRNSLGMSIVENLAKKDPAKAWTSILNSPDSWYQQGSQRWQLHHSWASTVLHGWAEKDPSGLKSFLVSKFDAAENSRESLLISQSLQDLSRGTYAKLVAEALAGRERNATMRNVWSLALEFLGMNDIEAALALIRGQSNPIARQVTARTVASGLSAKDPDRAIQIVNEYGGTNALQTVLMIMRNQASKAPKAMATQAMAIENVLARTEVIATVAGTWMQSEPAALADFALEAKIPERGASWLDVLANMHSGGVPVVQGKPWTDALSDEARVQVGRALRERLDPEAWGRISSVFEPVR
jgi:hypothetical protein